LKFLKFNIIEFFLLLLFRSLHLRFWALKCKFDKIIKCEQNANNFGIQKWNKINIILLLIILMILISQAKSIFPFYGFKKKCNSKTKKTYSDVDIDFFNVNLHQPTWHQSIKFEFKTRQFKWIITNTKMSASIHRLFDIKTLLLMDRKTSDKNPWVNSKLVKFWWSTARLFYYS
jgi:hypothetical protein